MNDTAPISDTSTPRPSTLSRLLAEAAGTFVLVFGVIGAATFAAGFDKGAGGLDVGFLGVALALGLAVAVGVAAFGPVSGGHFNPAVTIGLAIARRFAWRDAPGYVAAQIIGGLLGSTAIVAVAAGGPNSFLANARKAGFASTGWGALSPGGFPLVSAFLVELFTTCILVWVILGVTGASANSSAPLLIGLTLTVVALVAIPVSNGSFNPARSIATAVWGGPEALGQLWMSVVAPLAGGALAGGTFAALFGRLKADSS